MVSSAALAGASALLLLVVILGVGFLWWRSTQAAGQSSAGAGGPALPTPAQNAGQAVAAAAAVRRGGADRMRAGMRQRLANRAAAAAVGEMDDRRGAAHAAGGSGDDLSGDSEGEELGPVGRREEQRAARQAEREAREAAAARGSKTSAYDERRRAREAAREAQEQAQEEEMARAAEEARVAAEKEAAKWMKMMSVEQAGEEEGDAATTSAEALNNAMVDYIRARKMVPLDQLAVEFGIRTTEVIDKIHALEASGRLTGIMDERGKYIHVSEAEMKAVAAYITSKGRVAISELAAKSATLIDLEVKASAAGCAAGMSATQMPAFDALLGPSVGA